MGSIGINQILIVLLVVVVLFGARKLPEIGSGLGRAIRNFKKATSEPDEIDITPDPPRKKKAARKQSENLEDD